VFPALPSAAALAVWALLLVTAGWASAHTLTADGDLSKTPSRNRREVLPAVLAAAIARHPADDQLELLAATQALRLGDRAAAVPHLNRALRLHPAGGLAHRLAGWLLVTGGHRRQGALEYRLAAQHGYGMGYEEMTKTLGPDAIDAVQQRPDDLLEFARWLVYRDQAAAERACLRAVELAPDTERVLKARLEIAMCGQDPRILADAAQALTALERIEPGSWVQAAQALARAGRRAEADAALEHAMKQLPTAGSLVVAAAKLKLDGGDLAAARSLLSRRGALFTFEDRQQAEELLSQIADRMNDPAAALQARARARMIAQEREATP
jgi:predicted Zn-dependent protease